jgi:putative ABC transport system permease protein
MRLAAAYWWPVLRRSWRQALVLSLVGGLLGGVALGALAGARRTASAYDRYLRATNASDVMVDIPGQLPGVSYQRAIALISGLPGITSHAAFMGLNAFPVVHGNINDSFLTNDVIGSVDGAYFRQDQVVPINGTLPSADSATGIVLAPELARMFGVGVGGRVTYAFVSGTQAKPRYLMRSYTVAAIGDTPPVLVDQADKGAAAILSPAATRPLINAYSGYGWVTLRLDRGPAGIPDLQRRLTALAGSLDREVHSATGQPATGLSFNVQRSDLIRGQVQQAIKPESVALTIFGLIAALAMLVLLVQGLFQLAGRHAPDAGTLRALGATRLQVTGLTSLPGILPVAGITLVAAAVAIAVSPLAPVGPVRAYDPARGVHADPLVLGAGLPAIAALVLGAMTVIAFRTARPPAPRGATRAGTGVVAALRLRPTAAIGIRNVLATGSGRQAVPVLSTLGGSVVAVTAMVAAVVFSSSLTDLSGHPARYGWNWDVLVQAEGSWGSFNPGTLAHLVGGQPGVAGWSEMAFAQLPVDGRYIPVAGLQRELGTVAPPTTAGQPLSGPDQVELGASTLAELGKKLGDTVNVGSAPYARKVTITGIVTLPSVGVSETDHVSLGRGAMLPEETLLAAVGASGGPADVNISQPVWPSVAVIDLKPGTTAQQRAALVNRITSANPDGTPGGTYQLPPMQASVVYNAVELGRQPVALAAGLAVASVLSLSMTVLSLVRRRRHEFALLKALGMVRGQIRAVIAWQTSLTLLVALAVGVPLGIALGRLAWQRFAGSLGVVPVAAVPVLLLVAGAVVLVLTGNLLTSLPAALAARTRAALILKAE